MGQGGLRSNDGGLTRFGATVGPGKHGFDGPTGRVNHLGSPIAQVLTKRARAVKHVLKGVHLRETSKPEMS